MNLPPPDVAAARAASLKRYWRMNLFVLFVLLTLWALAGLGCGVLFADVLNQWMLPGTRTPLGFWFAQQGSIIIFVVLILVFCVVMNRLDAMHLAELQGLEAGQTGGAQEAPENLSSTAEDNR